MRRLDGRSSVILHPALVGAEFFTKRTTTRGDHRIPERIRYRSALFSVKEKIMNMEVRSNQLSPVLTDAPHTTKTSLVTPGNLISCSPTSNDMEFISRKKFKPIISNLGDLGTCFDSMKDSSPPRTRRFAKEHPANVGEAMAFSYLWEVTCPSALNSFKTVANVARGKRIILFLDYDGTLSPIVNDPECAFILRGMRPVIREAAKLFPTAIISGRRREQVRHFVRIPELLYAGSHGMDIEVPPNYLVGSNSNNNHKTFSSVQDEEVNCFEPARDYLPMLDEVFKSLLEGIKQFRGVKVENNKFCLSVHYRCVEERNWEAVGQWVTSIVASYSRLRLTHGRKVLEIRPNIKWDKGKAVEYFLEALGLAERHDTFPIYIGDDRTDEDAFQALRGRHTAAGIGILVSPKPKHTSAVLSLKDPKEVKVFLECLIKWKQSENVHREWK